MSENKSFRLYDSLEFFWRKKIWFIIIPVIAALIGYGASFLVPSNGKYVGKSTVFTGSVKLEALTNPDHIMTQYGKHFTGKTEVFVPTRSYIKTETYGDTEEQVKNELNQFNDQLLAGLMNQHDKVIGGTEKYASIQAERIETLKTTIEDYKKVLIESDNVTVINNFTTLLSAAEMDLTNALATEQRVRNDVIAYEKPSIAGETKVGQTETYGTQGAIAGFILGILLAILSLSMWKYLIDARNYRKA